MTMRPLSPTMTTAWLVTGRYLAAAINSAARDQHVDDNRLIS